MAEIVSLLWYSFRKVCDEKSEAYKAGYQNICEIGKERIRRAGKKILEENNQMTLEDKEQLDIGFKVFKLDSSNLKTWDNTPVTAEQLDLLYERMNNMIHRVKSDRSDLDMVCEIMLKLGVPLTYSITAVEINGKIAYSVSPKIGKWGGEGGSVIFSYNPEDKEDLLVTVFKNGEVGLSNLKKGMSQPNMLFAFAGSIDDILFISPARSTDYLLLISDKEGEKRYRIVPLDMLEKSMSIQPKSNLVLVPEKGIFVFAEILIPELVNSLDDEKSLQDTFDQYCAGRLWEHNSYIKNVDKISNLCNVPF